jgi:hypothetical protein
MEGFKLLASVGAVAVMLNGPGKAQALRREWLVGESKTKHGAGADR